MSRSFRHSGWLVVLLAAAAPVSASDAGRVRCEILENGQPASGIVSVQRDGKEVDSGACGKEFSVPEGTYTAAIRLDGALDGPEQKQPLTVKAGRLTELKADFPTGILTVRIASQGKRAAGLAMIRRNGQQLGTLGSGVSAHLTAGTYRIVVRYRTQEKDLGDVTLARGQRVTLDANFE